MIPEQEALDRERLSAFADDALPQQEGVGVVERMKRDPEMRRRWARYHLMGEALRGGIQQGADQALAERISAAMQREPVILAPRRAEAVNSKAMGVSMALAASVLFAIVLPLVFHAVGRNQSEQKTVAANSAIETPEQRAERQMTSPVFGRITNQSLLPVSHYIPRNGTPIPPDKRLNSYLVHFNEEREGFHVFGSPGVLPYVRLVGAQQHSGPQ